MSITDVDLQALVESCIDDGKTFPDIVKEVRCTGEAGSSIITGVQFTEYGLVLAAADGNTRAREILEKWRRRNDAPRKNFGPTG